MSGNRTGFLSEVGQRYEVNGSPSMVTSTRRCTSSTVTWTPFSERFANALPPTPDRTKRHRASLTDIRLSPGEHLFCFVVEGDLLPGLDRGDIHAQRDRVAITGINAGVRRL